MLTAQPGKYRISGDTALLGAFCLFLSTIEYLIPKPLPFMRIGLANLPLLAALGILSRRDFSLLVLIKILGQALITGTLFSYVFLFSLAGTAASALAMYSLFSLNPPFPAPQRMGLTGIGIAGAFVSNAVQLLLARFFVFGESVRFLAPPFLAAGIICGAALGFFAETFTARSQWILRRKEPRIGDIPGRDTADADDIDTAAPHSIKKPGTFVMVRFILGFLFLLVFLLIDNIYLRTGLFAVFWILALAAKKQTRPFMTILAMSGIITFNLFPSYGKILFKLGPLIIAQGSLLGGLRRAVTLEGLIMLSKITVTAGLPLPGRLGKLLRDTLDIFNRLNTLKGTLQKKALMQKLDELLLHLSQ